MKIQILSILRAILFVAISQGCSAENAKKESEFIDSQAVKDVITKKIYPPYPNVWWRKIDINEINFPLYAMELESGDILFVSVNPQGSSPKDYGSDTYEVGIEFFSGKEYEISWRDLKARGLTRLEYLVAIRVGEHEYKVNTASTHPLGDYKGLSNRVGIYESEKKIFEKSFIFILNKPREFRSQTVAEGPINFTETLYSINFRFIPLKDGSFLAVDRNSGFIIRFGKDFSTKAEIMSKKIHILDYSIVEEFKHQASRRDDNSEAGAFYSAWGNLIYQHLMK